MSCSKSKIDAIDKKCQILWLWSSMASVVNIGYLKLGGFLPKYRQVKFFFDVFGNGMNSEVTKTGPIFGK